MNLRYVRTAYWHHFWSHPFCWKDIGFKECNDENTEEHETTQNNGLLCFYIRTMLTCYSAYLTPLALCKLMMHWSQKLWCIQEELVSQHGNQAQVWPLWLTSGLQTSCFQGKRPLSPVARAASLGHSAPPRAIRKRLRAVIRSADPHRRVGISGTTNLAKQLLVLPWQPKQLSVLQKPRGGEEEGGCTH